MKRILFTAFLTISSISISSIAAATTYPFTFKDDLGRTVTIKAEPKHIISVLPSNTEIICALGACNRLIGVDDYSNFPESVTTLPKVGGLYNPNLEQMVALQPDLIVISKYGKLVEPLSRAGITVVAINPEKYAEIFSKTTILGKVLNLEAAAKNLNLEVQSKVKLLELRVRALKHPTAYFEIDPTPYTIGPDSFMGVMLRKAGAVNIIPNTLGDFPKISPELVLEKNPQIMLGLTLEEAQKRPGWSEIAAVKTGKVFDITGTLNDTLVRPGPRIALGLEGLIKIVHPELKN